MSGRRRLQAAAAGTALSQAVGMGRAARRPQRRRSSPASMRRPTRRTPIDLGGRRHEGFAQARTGAGRQPVRQGGRACEGRQRGRAPCRGRGLHRRLGDAACSICCRSMAARRRCRCADYADGAGPAARRGRHRGAGRSSTASCSTGWRSSARRTSSATACRGRQRKRRPSERFIAEASALSEGDLVVHREHGVGRYEGLVTLEIQCARHDCLQADLRRRRQAVRAGREHRRAEPLRRGGGGRRARPAGRRRLAVAQGAAQAAHRRHGRPADQDRGRARDRSAARR